jgi:hypothetical protein
VEVPTKSSVLPFLHHFLLFSLYIQQARNERSKCLSRTLTHTTVVVEAVDTVVTSKEATLADHKEEEEGTAVPLHLKQAGTEVTTNNHSTRKVEAAMVVPPAAVATTADHQHPTVRARRHTSSLRMALDRHRARVVLESSMADSRVVLLVVRTVRHRHMMRMATSSPRERGVLVQWRWVSTTQSGLVDRHSHLYMNFEASH